MTIKLLHNSQSYFHRRHTDRVDHAHTHKQNIPAPAGLADTSEQDRTKGTSASMNFMVKVCVVLGSDSVQGGNAVTNAAGYREPFGGWPDVKNKKSKRRKVAKR